MRRFFPKRLFLFAIVLFMAAGCAERWQKPGATEQDFDAASSVCSSRAAARFPPLYRQVLVDNGYRTPIVTRCRNEDRGSTCITHGGEYVPPSWATIDENRDVRRQDYRACLFENGWTPER